MHYPGYYIPVLYFYLCIICKIFLFTNGNYIKFHMSIHGDNNYPTSIPYYPVRKSTGTNHEYVSRGRFEFIDGFTSNNQNDNDNDNIELITENTKKKNLIPISLAEFKNILQCAPNEPDLHEKLSFWKLIPFTRNSLKIMW